MPDYGHDIRFGYFLIPDASDPRGVLETALLTDRLGYDLLAVQDHPYQRRHLDALSLLAVILGQTERIEVMQDVANVPLRPPAVFAKAAASLDLLVVADSKPAWAPGASSSPLRRWAPRHSLRAKAWTR